MHDMKIPFHNTETAFQYKSTWELTQAYLLFKGVGSPALVHWGARFLNAFIHTPIPFDPLLRATLFKQFCGGETAHACSLTVRKLAEYGVGTVLDYSIEGAQDETVFDATEKELLSNLTLASQSKSVPFTVFKMTGLVRFTLLEKLHQKTALTEAETKEWHRAQERVRRIIEKAAELKVRVLVDAEETWIQDPIDTLVEGFMKTFNQTQPTVYHTLQMYRSDRLDYLKKLLQKAQRDSFICAVKLVRGAYMEKERKRAESKGMPSPILPNKQATDASYDAALKLLIDSTENAAIFAGTHNEQSSQFLVDLMLEKGIDPKDLRFYFSQLLGMSDHLTFNLARCGFNTAKYVPYGPVRELTPYLIRRAQENSAISGQSLRELELIEKELKRRKTAK